MTPHKTGSTTTPGDSLATAPPTRTFGLQGPTLGERVVDLRLRERGVRAERHARALRVLPFNFRQEQVGPVVGAMHVARPQRGGHAVRRAR